MAKLFKFSVLYVANLIINNLFPFFKTTIEMAEQVKAGLSPLVLAAFNNFKVATEMFGAQTNKNMKSGFTDEMKQVNKEREAYFGEIKRIMRSYLNSSDPVKKAAATLMNLFLAPYKNVTLLKLNSETGILEELLVKYKARPDLIAAAATLGLTLLFATLEAKNIAFDALFTDRNLEYSLRESSSTLLKPAAVEAYMEFATAVEQCANLTPDPIIIALFNQMDALRKNYYSPTSPAEPDVPPVV